MRTLLVVIATIFYAHAAEAAQFRLENVNWVKAERWHQFRAYLYKDDGSRLEVTADTRFQALGTQSRNNGEFYFELPRLGRGNGYNVMLTATYSDENGTYQDSQNIRVDTTPDYIDMKTSYMTRPGGTLLMRVYGIYGSKRIDLTDQGQWRAIYGYVTNFGHYRAPLRQVTDRVTFRFGNAQSSTSVYVR